MSFYVNTIGDDLSQFRPSKPVKQTYNDYWSFEEILCLHKRDVSNEELSALLDKPVELIEEKRKELGIKDVIR